MTRVHPAPLELGGNPGVDRGVLKPVHGVGVALLVWAGVASAADEGKWETVVTGPITVKNRAIPNSSVKEIWAEGEIAAPVQDIQEACMRVERFRYFMPYLKDSREISAKLPDNSVYVYTLIDLPVVGKRDYVVRTWLRESVAADGTGTFRNEWKAFPDYLPRRSGISRVELNEGGWKVTPTGDGSKSWAVYKFTVDPGGWVPAFAANMGNERGVADTFKAVEAEALRRKEARLAEAAKKKDASATPAPAPGPSGSSAVATPGLTSP